MLAALGLLCLVCVSFAAEVSGGPAPSEGNWLAPSSLVASPDQSTLYIGCSRGERLLVMDVQGNRVRNSFKLPGPLSGMTISRDGSRLFVTCAAPESIVCMLDPRTGAELTRITTGHTACSPVLSPDGTTLYVCCQFDDSIAVLNLDQKKELRRIPVLAPARCSELSRDGKYLLVANMLPVGRADRDEVAAAISVIDVSEGKPVKTLRLPTAAVPFTPSQYPPTDVMLWPRTSSHVSIFRQRSSSGLDEHKCKTIVDLQKLEVLETVLVDNVESGAANPWGIAWADDGRKLLVAHAAHMKSV
jgi:WD40 repeat protein